MASYPTASFGAVQTLTSVSDRVRELVQTGEYFWLDLERPSEDDLRRLADMAGLAGRSVRDAVRWGEYPQLREYRDQLFLVFYGGDVEVHLFVSGSWVVTVHGRPAPMLDRLREQLAEDAAEPEARVVARILAALADSYNDVLDPIYDRLQEIEQQVAAAEASMVPTRALREEVLGRRGHLLKVARVVRRQRDYVERAVTDIERLPGLERAASHDLRDVVNEMIRVGDRVDDALGRLAASLELLNATMANRLNLVTERLTVVATIFLPLTVVTGFFGMNFAWMVERIDTLGAFLVLGVGISVGSGLAIWLWVRGRLERGLAD
jgi:magnesium transporter